MNVIFSRLAKFGLALNVNKSQFCVSEVQFLGHKITPVGYQITDERVQFMKNLKRPGTIEALRRVLGILNFYKRFKRTAAATLAPLNDVLKGYTKRRDRTTIKWTEELDRAFEDAKKLFSEFTLLHDLRDDSVLYSVTDASSFAVGVVLEQIDENGNPEPLGYFSKKLTDTQRNWSTSDRELYALYAAAENFEYLLEGREVVFVTDHRPLTHMFTMQKNFKIQRRSRQIEYLSRFTGKVVHVSGANNTVADGLSRMEVDASATDVTLTMKTLPEAQMTDEEIKKIRLNGYRHHVITELLCEDGSAILCSSFRDRRRPIVPEKLRFDVY